MLMFSILLFSLATADKETEIALPNPIHQQQNVISSFPLTDTLPKAGRELTLISSSQLAASKEVLIRGCSFDLVANGTDTIYLSTYDSKFTTPEGYRVGTRFTALPVSIQKKLIQQPGWGFYYTLPSGWSLGFCEGASCTASHPNSMSSVKWIFKRK